LDAEADSDDDATANSVWNRGERDGDKEEGKWKRENKNMMKKREYSLENEEEEKGPKDDDQIEQHEIK
jgi:hypothetical protein